MKEKKILTQVRLGPLEKKLVGVVTKDMGTTVSDAMRSAITYYIHDYDLVVRKGYKRIVFDPKTKQKTEIILL